MDAKAENTETASAAPASEDKNLKSEDGSQKTEDGKKTTGSENAQPGRAVRTIEERLQAGLEREFGTLPPEDKDQKTDEPDESDPSKEDEVSSKSDKAADKPEPDKVKDDDSDDEGKLSVEEMEGLSEKAQKKVNARIHEINIRRKNAEAKAEQTETQLNLLKTKIQDENVQSLMKEGFNPEDYSADEAKTLNRFFNLQSWKEFYRKHRGGYEAEDPKNSLTPEEVAEKEAAIEEPWLDTRAEARKLLQERFAQKRSDEARGRKARLEEENKTTRKPELKPPKLPEASGATRKPPVSAGNKPRPVFDKKEFDESGADKNALEKQYEKIFGK